MNIVVLSDPSGEGAKAGPWGLAVILILCVACYFLFKSMSKHLRKVREEFPSDDTPSDDTPVTAPSPTAAASRTEPTAGEGAAAGAEAGAGRPSLVKADRASNRAQRPPAPSSPPAPPPGPVE